MEPRRRVGGHPSFGCRHRRPTFVRNRVEAEPKGGRRITTFATGVIRWPLFFTVRSFFPPACSLPLYNPALELDLMRTWRPILVFGGFIALFGVSGVRPALAQLSPTTEEEQQAKNRWAEGKSYAVAGNYEAARVAFKQAYTIFPHPAILQNLGEVELRTGRLVEASRHLAAFLRTDAARSAAQREAAKKSLERASEKLGSIVVETNVPDAEVRIDDEVVGRSPFEGLNWYVEPGPHVVNARKTGYLDGSEKVNIVAGPPKNVFVRLARVLGPLPDDSPAPAAVAPVAPVVSLASPVPPPAASEIRTTSGGIQPRTVVLIAGATITVGAAALGIGFASKVSSESEQLSSVTSQLPLPPGGSPSTACFEPKTPQLMTSCAWIASYNQGIRKDRLVRDVAFIAAAGFGMATVATFFLWHPANSDVSVAPILSPHIAGLEWSGTF